ncbi:unnamed protein product [Triticum turgidum subsp. durum]|uniref:Uncharacterized protein n=1 Tax=Triticum turgidum subsp. durum TaxID=4567 RepID=A0A9R0SBZ5_TRITD|nr:unnamed protein product [Triticum turgidum subsp. durum]
MAAAFSSTVGAPASTPTNFLGKKLKKQHGSGKHRREEEHRQVEGSCLRYLRRPAGHHQREGHRGLPLPGAHGRRHPRGRPQLLRVRQPGTQEVRLRQHHGRLLHRSCFHGQACCPSLQELHDPAQHQDPTHLGYLGRQGSRKILPV